MSKHLLLKNSYTSLQKQEITSKLVTSTLEQIEKEMLQLIQQAHSDKVISPYSKIGNNIVDYFTLIHRLETRGKYNINFYDFVEHIEYFKQKKFIQNMIQYYQEVKNKHGKKEPLKVYKEIYNICISAINIMKPINCIELFKEILKDFFIKFGQNLGPIQLLNFCLGWGGTMVASAALQLDTHIGIDINIHLQPAYEQLEIFLKNQKYGELYQDLNQTHFQTICQDALIVDYSQLNYNVVFASPPYYFIEIYENNRLYATKQEMNALFYKPLFQKTFDGLQTPGIYMINVCKEVYTQVLEPLLGIPHQCKALKKSKRQNNHTELIYIWYKI